MAPSLQLLKPTASSLGHRVAKVTHSPDLISNTTQVKSSSRSYLLNAESPKEYQFCRSLSTGCTDNDATKARSLTTDCSFRVESINRVETSSLDPFRNICLSSNTSMDDEEMEHIGNDNERQAMQYDAIPTGTSFNENNAKGGSSPATHNTSESDLTPLRTLRARCASWSQGSEVAWSQFHLDNNTGSCLQRLRSHVFDPVASHLLTCFEGQESRSQSPWPCMEGDDSSAHDNSPREHQHHSILRGNFSVSASMPNLLSAPSNDVNKCNGTKEAVEEPTQCRRLSGRLLDVKSDEEMKFLDRPIPRKCI